MVGILCVKHKSPFEPQSANSVSCRALPQHRSFYTHQRALTTTVRAKAGRTNPNSSPHVIRTL